MYPYNSFLSQGQLTLLFKIQFSMAIKTLNISVLTIQKRCTYVHIYEYTCVYIYIKYYVFIIKKVHKERNTTVLFACSIYRVSSFILTVSAAGVMKT